MGKLSIDVKVKGKKYAPDSSNEENKSVELEQNFEIDQTPEIEKSKHSNEPIDEANGDQENIGTIEENDTGNKLKKEISYDNDE
jgi:hypothetical protein